VVRIVPICAALLVFLSCATYHTDKIRRGRPISKMNVEKLKIGETDRSRAEDLFGSPYYVGKIGETDILCFIFKSGFIKSNEYGTITFKSKQPDEFKDLPQWRNYLNNTGTEKVAVTQFEEWRDQELWLYFENGVLVSYQYYYTPVVVPRR